MSMEVELAADGDGHVVRVAGEVDLDTSPRLWQQLQQALKQAGRLAVDLSGVTYIDSSGVAILIQGLKHAKKRGTAYCLRDPSARVMSVLELAQLPKLFDIETTGPGS